MVSAGHQERPNYGSQDYINRETLENDPSVNETPAPRESSAQEIEQETANVEVIPPREVREVQQQHTTLQADQVTANFAV